MNPQVITHLVSQHAEGAAFLWLVRQRYVDEPHWDLGDIIDIDERIEAHLDGLRVAGDDGWGMAREQLEQFPQPGEAFTAAVLALGSNNPLRFEGILQAAVAEPKIAPGIASALGWVSDGVANSQIVPLFAHPSPVVRRIGVAAAADRRLALLPGFNVAMSDADAGVLARALRAAGELGATSSQPALRRNQNHPDFECRFSACWSLARLGERSAVTDLQMIAQTGPGHRAQAMDLAIRRLEPGAAFRWLEALYQIPGSARLALQGFGRFGDSTAVPRLLDAMRTPALARVAGEALTFISGVDLAALKLDASPPPGFEAGPSEDPADENVAIDPDENLPWPDLAKVSGWWGHNRGQFPPGKRLFLGRPIVPEWLREVLKIGKQRQRAAAALELAVREPAKPLFDVRAPGHRQ